MAHPIFLYQLQQGLMLKDSLRWREGNASLFAQAGEKCQPFTNQSAVWGLGLRLRVMQNVSSHGHQWPWEQTDTTGFSWVNSSGTSVFLFLDFILSCVLLFSISIALRWSGSSILMSHFFIWPLVGFPLSFPGLNDYNFNLVMPGKCTYAWPI